MKLNEQVCTLEQAKRLKELGVIQNSLWYWNTIYLGAPQLSLYNKNSTSQDFFKCGVSAYNGLDISDFMEPYYSAFTVAELSNALPLQVKGRLELYKFRRNDGLWFVHYSYIVKDPEQCEYLMLPSITDYNEATACCAMLIYLLEKNLVTAGEVNDRLK